MQSLSYQNRHWKLNSFTSTKKAFFVVIHWQLDKESAAGNFVLMVSVSKTRRFLLMCMIVRMVMLVNFLPQLTDLQFNYNAKNLMVDRTLGIFFLCRNRFDSHHYLTKKYNGKKKCKWIVFFWLFNFFYLPTCFNWQKGISVFVVVAVHLVPERSNLQRAVYKKRIISISYQPCFCGIKWNRKSIHFLSVRFGYTMMFFFCFEYFKVDTITSCWHWHAA